MNLQIILQKLANWFLGGGIRVVLILIAAFAADRLIRIFVERVVYSRVKNGNGKRAETLIEAFKGTFSLAVWIIAVLMILPEFRVNILPILTGLGLVGLAVGMAARDIVSDFISGFFILLEGQYYVGDRIKVSGIEGEVKEITLRRTLIQDKFDFMHLIPNSQIRTVARHL